MAMFARLLTATVGLLLLVACLAVGMLLLVRTEARREEFAMCLALGATRGRLALGVALEAAVLAISSVLLAVPVSSWLLHGVRAFQLPGRIEVRLLHLGLDGRIVASTGALAAISMVVITAIASAFAFTARSDEAIRGRSGATRPTTARRGRAMLVGGQVAVALVLVAGAGLFARSLVAALYLNPGFDTGRLVTAYVNFPQYGFDPARATPLFDDLKSRLDADSAIRSLAMTVWTGGMTSRGTVTVDGIARHFPSMVSFTTIDERYFATVGLPILGGRDFTARDRDGAPLVAIVSKSFGRLLANGADPVGHRIEAFSSKVDEPFPVFEVVGVVPDVVTNVNDLEPLVLYRPVAQESPAASRTILMRASADTSSAIRETESALRVIDPAHSASLGKIETVDQALVAQLEPQQFGAVVLGALGGIAALLAALGAYVLAESMSAVRLREMGIRAAMGASREQLVNLLLADTGRLVVAGLVAGLGLAWLGASTIRSLLFQVRPLDPVTLATAGIAILVMTLLVSLGPALRAARVDLAGLLRSE
jgi:predicted permease